MDLCSNSYEGIDGSVAVHETPWIERVLREWLVIECSWKRSVWRDDELPEQGYIPREAAEKLLGRDLGGNVWFSREESEQMRAHPDWRDTEPPMPSPAEFL